MSLTAIIFLIIYFVGIVATLYNPFYGVLVYIFEWHNHPPYMWWGNSLPNLRWSYTIALVTLISLVVNYKKLPKLSKNNIKPVIWLIFLVMTAYSVSFVNALVPEESFAKAEVLLKYMVNFVIMVTVIRTYKDYRMVIWVLLFMVANFGRMAWEGGHMRDFGFIAPNATEENAISAHVMAVLPFFMFTFFLGKRWTKLIVILLIPFCLNLIILANSRGAFLGALVIALFTILWTSGKMRLKVLLAVIVGGIMFLYLTNDKFWERQATIEKYQEESSAMSRIYLWNGAIKVMRDYPFGVGVYGFETLCREYVPELRQVFEEKGDKTVHNSFLNVGTEWGFLGLFFFLGFIIHCMVYLSKIKGLAKHVPKLSHFYFEATAIQLSILGTLAAGMFTNRNYAEILYWLCAFSLVLKNIFDTERDSIQNENPATTEIVELEGEPIKQISG